MRGLTVTVLMLLLAGCSSTGQVSQSGEVLSLAPVESSMVAHDYQRLAECAYAALQQPGIQKADFPGTRTIKISVDGGGVRYWEIAFASVGRSQTRVDIAAAVTLFGPLGYGKLMPAVRGCAA